VLDAYSPLARYLLAATLVRGADGGAAVGVVLLTLTREPGRAGVAGLLAAALTAPHLLGPWLARRLDRARDGRVVLAGAFAAYGIALAAATLALGRVPLAGVVGAVAAAGACGPLLTGGLSSRLAGVAGSSGGRAEGWDAVTYGVAGTAGPAAVAALAALTTPAAAMLALAGAALAAAPIALTLPRTPTTRSGDRDALPVRTTLLAMGGHGPLRRVTVATLLTALGVGGLSVVAAVLGSDLSSRPGAGATLVAAFGLGNLAGSLLVTAFPLRGEPDRLTGRYVAVMAAALGLCALAPSYPLALAAFALAGASNAPYFTATLAARSRYAPPGARAQVFVSLAGAKVAMASLGAAVAGATIGLGPRTLLLAGAAITAAAAAATVIDRRVTA
jgi:hypothetical protein